MREQGRSKTGGATLPRVKLAPVSAPGLSGERQGHLDAIIASAGAGQRRRLFGGVQISGRSFDVAVNWHVFPDFEILYVEIASAFLENHHKPVLPKES